MKILVENRGIGVNSIHVWKLNKDTIKVLVDTKLKYPEVYRGSSYEGTNCTELHITLMDEKSEKATSISLIPENEWEKLFINQCDYFLGSTRYGPEIIYIRTKLANPNIGLWENKESE